MMKKSNSEDSSIEEAIIKIIDHYENELTEKQKANILEGLVKYEKKRSKKQNKISIKPLPRDYF